jgi:hypothetical protein
MLIPVHSVHGIRGSVQHRERKSLLGFRGNSMASAGSGDLVRVWADQPFSIAVFVRDRHGTGARLVLGLVAATRHLGVTWEHWASGWQCRSADCNLVWSVGSNLESVSHALPLDIFTSRCILRGSEFGARHANFSEADPHANNVAPARELTVAGRALPEADWADLRIARTHKPPAGILAEGFLLFGAVYARRHVQSDSRAAASREGGRRDRRYLHAQIGRPWNKVFSEICAGIDRRNTVQQHIHQHIRDFIAVDVDVREGRLVDLSGRWGFLRRDSGISQELYVDPRTGLIRPNKGYNSWRHGAGERRRREQVEIETRRRIVDERTFLLLLGDVWFCVEVDVLPKERFAENAVDSKPHKHVIAEPRYDVVLRRNISRAMRTDLQQCKHLYGSGDLYAVRKRQLSTREIKAHRLR